MYDQDTKSRFLELRAMGWSLAKISEHLQVAERSLADWNRQHQVELRHLRRHRMEALQEKILASRDQELSALAQQLKRVEQEISQRQLDNTPTKELFRLAALLRKELRALRIDPDALDEPPPKPSPP